MIAASTPTDTWLIMFRLHNRDFALPIDEVVELVRMVAITEIPDAPPWLAGMIDLRGRTVPTIDLRVRLGLPPKERGLDDVIIVAGRDEVAAGLIADEALDALAVPAGSIKPPAPLAGSGHPLLGLVSTGERVVLVLDVRRLVHELSDLELPDDVALGA